MKRIWKWLIGIGVALVVIAAIVGVVFLVRNNPNLFAFASGAAPVNPGFNRPNLPNGPAGQMPRGGFGWRGMMPRDGHGFDRFGGFAPVGFGWFLLGDLFRLLLPLGVLVLVAVLFYELGRRAGTAAAAAPAPAPEPARGRKVAKS